MSDDRREMIPQGQAAVSLAAFQLTQSLTIFLIDAGILPAAQAVEIIRGAALSELHTADEHPQPASDAAAHILELFPKGLEKKHLKK